MSRQHLLSALRAYHTPYADEKQMVEATIGFIEANPDCFERSLLTGHVTGSAWILNDRLDAALLIHHAKLDKWFQPGGHCDGDPDVMAVAAKEAFEETGVAVRPVSGAIFDMDVHHIPAKNDVPAHLHYDVRYAFTGEMDKILLEANREIKGGRWLKLSEIPGFNSEASILRMIDKSRQLQVEIETKFR